MSGQPLKFTPAGGLRFLANSRIDDNAPVKFQKREDGDITGFTLGIQEFTRVSANPKPLPKSWHNLLGSYGPDFIPIIVSERQRVDRIRERFGSPTFALRRVRQAEDAVRVATEELEHARAAADREGS